MKDPAPIAGFRQVELALDHDATVRGEGLLARAADEAALALAAARTDAERIVREAKDEGAAIGARLESAARAAARRDAREIVLGAREDAYQLLRQQVIEELSHRKDSSEVRRLNSRLQTRSYDVLGSGASVVWDPVGVGLTAVSGARRLDSSAARLVDACLAELGQAVERLWS